MKINFLDNTTTNVSFNSAACTGYVAQSIELSGLDVKAMRQIYERDPLAFGIFLLQLENRFPENRPVPVPFQRVKKPYRCGPCGSTDPTRYTRCNHAGCPDGRDQ